MQSLTLWSVRTIAVLVSFGAAFALAFFLRSELPPPSADSSPSRPTVVVSDEPPPSLPKAKVAAAGPATESSDEVAVEFEGGQGVEPPPEYAPRDAAEWQGMLVNLTHQALCDESVRCGLAMACRAGQCGPCQSDADCGQGEGCAVQHCVPLAQVECRSRADCAEPDDLCMLSGLSSDTRGNAKLRAYCGSVEDTDDRRLAEREEEPAVDPDAPAPEPGPMLDGSSEHLAQMLMQGVAPAQP